METRRTRASASPEFEFWMVRNPSLPPPNLVPADQLFVDGILLPLQLLHLHLQNQNQNQNQTPKDPADPQPHPPEIPTHPPATAGSKRWTDIFKKSATPATTKTQEDRDDKLNKEKEKSEKKKERKSQTIATSAELNINIWPFSRSRSAGNNSGARPRMFPGTRKVNSAPCSRSNSSGDSKSRKWPSSPGRPGLHIGRSSPVWQVRRSKNSYSELSGKKESRRVSSAAVNSKTSKVVNLNGPMCVGYRQHLSCRSDEGVNGGRNGGVGGGNSSGNVGSGSSLFNLRGLFSKKVY